MYPGEKDIRIWKMLRVRADPDYLCIRVKTQGDTAKDFNEEECKRYYYPSGPSSLLWSSDLEEELAVS